MIAVPSFKSKMTGFKPVQKTVQNKENILNFKMNEIHPQFESHDDSNQGEQSEKINSGIRRKTKIQDKQEE